jgi:hypothetical protein
VGGRWFGLGYEGVFSSQDGLTWQLEDTDPASCCFYGIAGSSDAMVLVAGGGLLRKAGPVRGAAVYVPAAAHLAGLNGSVWRTDLEVHNPGPLQLRYIVELLKRGAENTSPDAVTFSLGPGQSIRYVDAVASLFGITGAGTLRVSPLGGVVMASARTYNDAATGTYGQLVAALLQGQSTMSEQAARLTLLSQSVDRARGFRTNIGLVSASFKPIVVEVELYRADGTMLGRLSYPLRAFESIQSNEIFGEVTTDAIENGYAIVRTTTEGGQFFAYATVIDNRTNDPVYIPAR